MLKIQYPEYNFKIKRKNDVQYIFDEVRKKWIALTPEEWVRQNFIQYLIIKKNYPSSLMAIEKEIILGELKKRCDILIFQNNIPWMIVECKKEKIQLSNRVLEQILRYNMALPVEFLIVTNGSFSFGWQRKENDILTIESLPEWSS